MFFLDITDITKMKKLSSCELLLDCGVTALQRNSVLDTLLTIRVFWGSNLGTGKQYRLTRKNNTLSIDKRVYDIIY